MEINVHELVEKSADLWPCYGSVATHGFNAGVETWEIAKATAGGYSFVTEENRGAVIEYFEGIGLSCVQYCTTELNALVIQEVCAQLSESDICLDTLDWGNDFKEIKLKIDSSCARLYVGTDDKLYLYLGW